MRNSRFFTVLYDLRHVLFDVVAGLIIASLGVMLYCIHLHVLGIYEMVLAVAMAACTVWRWIHFCEKYPKADHVLMSVILIFISVLAMAFWFGGILFLIVSHMWVLLPIAIIGITHAAFGFQIHLSKILSLNQSV